MRILLLLIVRTVVWVAIAWLGLWRESAGTLDTVKFRRWFVILGAVVLAIGTCVEVWRGSELLTDRTLPLWISMGIAAITSAMTMALLVVSFRIGLSVRARTQPPLTR